MPPCRTSKRNEDMLQFKIFTVPLGDPAASDEMNRFLAGHRVLTVQRELVQKGELCAWTFCVEYLAQAGAPGALGARKERMDYKTVLPPAQFAVFARLRECRKDLAAKDGLPAFAVCTDEQLAAMAKLENPDVAALKGIEGFGAGKAAKYAEALLAAMALPGNPQTDGTEAVPPGADADSGGPTSVSAVPKSRAGK